jgi:carbon monoxide dehydrogenase subunit G
MLMSSYDLLANRPGGEPVRAEELPEQMSGVLCRCTGYRGILDAVADVAAHYPEGVPAPRNCGERTLVGRGPRHAAAPSAEPGEAPVLPREVRVPTGAPSATVAVASALTSPIGQVWSVIADFEKLARCLPGAQLVEVLGEDRYRGRATVALGPVKLSFEGLAQVVEHDPDGHRMRVLAQGADASGSATQAVIRLAADQGGDGGTSLRADVDLFLSGRIAQFGRALAGDVSRRMFEQFAAAVDETARTGSAPEPGRAPSAAVIALGALRDALRRGLVRLRSLIRRT